MMGIYIIIGDVSSEVVKKKFVLFSPPDPPPSQGLLSFALTTFPKKYNLQNMYF